MAINNARACGLAPLLFVAALFSGGCDAGLILGDPDAGTRGGLVASLAEGSMLLDEPAQAGLSEGLHLVDVRWGRAVDVYALDPLSGEPVLVLAGFVADPSELGQAPDVELTGSLLGAGQKLTLQHELGSAGLARRLERLEAGLVPLSAGGPSVATLPRDATLVLRFDDLIDPTTVESGALTLRADGATLPAQVQACTSHGTVIAGARYSARLVVDLAPSLAALPDAEVTLRLALAPGAALTNLCGHGLVAPGAGPALELAFRAGGVDGGVLDDTEPPFVVGRLPGQVTAVAAAPGSKAFSVDFLFATAVCAFAAQPGDVLSTPGHVAEVLGASAPPAGGASIQMRVRLRSGDPTTFVPAAGELRSRWTSAVSAPPECFVTILPTPAQAPANGASTASVVRLAFSEPMDLGSVRALDTFRLAYGQPASPSPLAEHVVGEVVVAPGLREYTFQPALPLRHTSGVAERYFVRLSGGPTGVRDLAGNALGFDLPQTSLLVLRGEPIQDTGSLSLNFSAPDEDGDGAPELRGQLLYDLAEGSIRGRPVVRFSGVADPAQPLVGAMVPFAAPLQTPLNPLGAKLMSVWRYADLGQALLDESYHNLDVEGLAWAPYGGALVADQFAQFRMALAHSSFLPDEVVGPALLPSYRNTGLVPTYAANLLDPVDDPLTVVHDKSQGYTLSPLDLFVASTGTPMMPWPMNRNVPAGQYTYWTWRDTAKLAVGAPGGVGADPARLPQITGVGLTGFYPPDAVPTIGLPLLTEYRCYPDSNATGLNGFQVAIALNSSYKPTFRAYSAGGVGPSGTKLVDPDLEPVATGGINPSTGGATQPIDNSYYYGQADFVVRVSRGHTRWLDTGATASFAQAVAETRLPAGTQVLLAFRGASSISAALGQPWVDASNLGPYGDAFTTRQLGQLGQPAANTFRVQFFPSPSDPSWNDDLTRLDGARFVQARISFVADAVAQSVPVLDGLGIAFRR